MVLIYTCFIQYFKCNLDFILKSLKKQYKHFNGLNIELNTTNISFSLYCLFLYNTKQKIMIFLINSTI